MKRQWWSEPVAIALGPDGTGVVSHTNQAIDLLTQRWPPGHEEKGSYRAACLACDRGLHDELAEDRVRAAFVKAAEEAGVLVEIGRPDG